MARGEEGLPGDLRQRFGSSGSADARSGRLSLLRTAAVLATNPARAFGIDHRKGAIAVGLDADFVVIDPAGTTEIDEMRMYSTATWSPYSGMSFPGLIHSTIVRGEEAYTDAAGLIAEPGDGVFIGRGR